MIISVDEAKAHLRVENDEEDAYISSLIKQAQAAAEDFTRVSFEGTDESGNAIPIPEPVQLAALLFVSHYYENRDEPDRQLYTAMRTAFEQLLYPYRDPEKMF